MGVLLTAASGCAASASTPPQEIGGAITWTMTRQVQDPDSPARETTVTTVAMDVAMRVTQSRAGVTLYRARDGAWTATGSGTADEHAAGCTITRDTAVDLRGSFVPAGNVMTFVHTRNAGRGLLNFSVSKGDGAVVAKTRYCDGTEVSQNRTYFWAISDAAVDVVARRADDGSLEFVVAKEQTVPCGPGATCTRTASGVLKAVTPQA
jgi:hypothetical protein